MLLPKFAAQLKKAGVERLNISLDTLDAEKYKHDHALRRILKKRCDGIDAAFDAAGFDNIKINAVLIGGVNDNEIPDFVRDDTG